MMTAIPDTTEIFTEVASMHGKKSPGPDGMSPLFYKKFWNIIGTDVVCVIQGVFSWNRLSKAVNHTFLTLIPKWTVANKVD